MTALLELHQKLAQEGECYAEIAGQIGLLTQCLTQAGKPYFELELVDGTGSRLKLRIWQESEAFEFLKNQAEGDFIGASAFFHTNTYGVNTKELKLYPLSDEKREAVLWGSEETRLKIEEDWNFVLNLFKGLREPRLKKITLMALERHEKRWKRAAAARNYHHAYRGGLLIHTAQMLRVAQAVAPFYPQVTPDLLYSGVLFHDIGKLWENDFEENGLRMNVNRMGEMMGHISIGTEFVNSIWREARAAEPALFEEAQPPSELLREHLLHLILSHHGTREFGSPVTPRTPEAWLLHHIDNMDAKIEMLSRAYSEKRELAPGIFEVRRPLEGSAILPFASCIVNEEEKRNLN